MTAFVLVRDLNVRAAGSADIVRGVSFDIEAGTAFTLAGESGSGKSLVAHALAGTVTGSVTVQGEVRVGAISMTEAVQARRAWGRDVLLLPQEPLAVLDPTLPVRAQVADIPRYIDSAPRREAYDKADHALAAVGLDASAARRRPHALSGGMRQRVLIAMALLSPAPLIVFDEPTKGLDATLRDGVARLMRGLLDRGKTIFCVTHDFVIPRHVGGKLAIMRRGEIVELHDVARVLDDPATSYTRALLASLPENGLVVPPDIRQ